MEDNGGPGFNNCASEKEVVKEDMSSENRVENHLGDLRGSESVNLGLHIQLKIKCPRTCIPQESSLNAQSPRSMPAEL